MNAALRRLAFGIGLAVTATAALLVRGDGPLPNDADLMAVPAPVADHQNGFILLSAAAELLRWPQQPAEDARWMGLARGESWDDAVAARAVAANDRAIDALARVVRAPAFQTPPVRDIRSDALPDLLSWLRLAKASAIRAIAEARRGDTNAALADAWLALRVSQRMSRDENATVMHAAFAQSVGAAGLDALEVTLPYLSLDAARSRELAAQLESLHTDTDAWKRMWAGEYRALRASLLACCDAAQARELAAEHAAPGFALWLPRAYLYQPNNSLKLYGARIRLRQMRAEQAYVPEAAESLASSPLTVLLPNYLGKLRVAQSAQLAWIDARRRQFDTRVEAARAAIALRAFERERGTLPPSLEALVPTYLGSVPRDWFSESALRLDRRERMVYSVGSDGVDNGGRPIDGDHGLLEPRFPLLEPGEPASADESSRATLPGFDGPHS